MSSATWANDSLRVREVPWDAPDAVALRTAMSAEIDPRYADRAITMPPPIGMQVDAQDLVYVGLAYRDEQGVGHVALRRLGVELELKKLFVDPRFRGTGVGSALLDAADEVARALRVPRIILQTGDRQPEAIALYESAGYSRIPIFAPYFQLPYSQCFEKRLPVIRTVAAP